MKKLLSMILAATMITTVALSLTACGEKSPAEEVVSAVSEAGEEVASAAEEVAEEVVSAAEEAAEEVASVAEEVASAAEEAVEEVASATEAAAEVIADAAEVLKVEFGDFDGQKALSKSIQNMECTDKAVEIEGTSSKVGTHYSIGQKNDGGEFVGTTYEFDGEYPADGAHVKVVGTVVTEGLASKIVATSVEVIE